MRVWEVIVDALTPGTPRHKRNVAALARETDRLDHLSGRRANGVMLHPLDEISLCTHEISNGFQGTTGV